jgi:hypothetical protein
MLVKTRQIMKVIADSGLLGRTHTARSRLGRRTAFNITGFHLVDEARLLAMRR